MPFVILIVAIIMITSAIRGTQSDMFALLKSEFSGTNSFIPWALAIIILTTIGQIKAIRPIADGFIVLVFVVMFVSPANSQGGGFFAQLNAALRAAPAPSPSPSTAPAVPQVPQVPDAANTPLNPLGYPSITSLMSIN